jgi:DNA helicase-2/ATP-dependent DNA helicase PcrA
MTLTAAQLDVLEEIDKNRITVVRAGPGAGKTRVFVEAFKREIERSDSSHRWGVAALSFTNVAHEEISNRIARTVSAPHFVGTLDAFLFRFVVRPFGSLAGLSAAGARLLPSPLDEVHRGPEVQYAQDTRKRASVFQARCVAGTEDAPVVRIDRTLVEGTFSRRVLLAKQNNWKTSGRLTHADVHYLAAHILRGPHGPAVREILSRRFAVLLIDEFQDTGYFLGRAVLSLLEDTKVKGVVVGDPDQAIFRFGGAQQTLFADVDAVAGRPGCLLDESHRCSRAVAAVATSLSRSGKVVRPLAEAHDGRATLLVYDQPPDVPTVIAKLRLTAEESVVTLARSNATVRSLSRSVATAAVPQGCRFGKAISRAVERFMDGDPNTAARITHSAFGEIIFDDANVDFYKLRGESITWTAWRTACHAILFEALHVNQAETWNAWLARVRERVRVEAERLGRPVPKIGLRVPKFDDDGENVRYSAAKAGTGLQGSVMTVHQAKGREFRTVIFYIPKPHKAHAPCPSVEWWSEDAGSEEREIAFVACSRAIHRLALVVHKKTFDALQSSQAGFVGLFDVVDI